MAHVTPDNRPDPKRLALLLAALIATAPFAIDTYLPAIPAMAADFGAATHAVEVSISTFLIGFALGQLIGGPLSDRIGRRPVALIGLVIYIITSAIITGVDSAGALNIMRFVQAIGGGFALVVVGASVRDLYDGKEAAQMFALIAVIMMIAPLAAPTVGSVLLVWFSWQAIFVLLIGYGSLMLVIVWFKMPETTKYRPHYAGPTRRVWWTYLEVLRTRKAVGFMLTHTGASAVMFSFLTDSPFMYIDFFGVTPGQFPYLFGANVMVIVICNRLNNPLLRRYELHQILKIATALQLAAVVGLFVAVNIFEPSLYVVVPLVMISVGMIGLTAPSATASFMQFFPHIGGTATALMGTIQFATGALAGMVIGHFHDGTLLPVTLSMLGFGIFTNVMVHFVAAAKPSDVTASLREAAATNSAE
ncbi:MULTISPECIES: multidrug effflux MFS transporter [Thalassospira]|uniref:Bcr/CflA family efflux transporter n=1 Tax=Thalassospira aquimaris TaxID=3037796 RepID=A0ABT6GAM3_9PROT|nr:MULTISPECIES: multidrug effflux MFS transporter [Thalassospira]MDG4719135.1 multidrug effflux MFS transporter [Thalassospira sp. FZY0004]